jgi:predicted dehydrogenase
LTPLPLPRDDAAMTDRSSNPLASRRQFIVRTGRIAATSALAGVTIPRVHAAGNETIQLAFVGCGGRGTGAAGQALAVKRGPTKLIAMADVFPERLSRSFNSLTNNRQFGAQVDVPKDRQFLGFDAYKKAMDCLKPGDIVILTTPPAFRWVHYTYAIEKGLNVFMEKPVTVDGPASRRMLKLNEGAKARNLKVGVGLNSRHARHLQELAKRVHDGEIGAIILERGYRMQRGGGTAMPKSPGISELMYQIQRFHSFIWASGGVFSDYYIHIIDHLSWMKNAWPVKAQALGGRHYRQTSDGRTFVDQNLDTYSVEYTFADGTKFYFDGRNMPGCYDNFSSYIHGTKGSAVASRNGDCGGPSAIFKGQTPKRSDLVWESKTPPGEEDWYQNEWNDLVDAIRNDQPYNEVERGVTVSLVTAMGRMAAHTGQEITYEDMLNCEHEMAPGLDKLTSDSPAPLLADKDGKYPVPMPGRNKTREY